MNRYDSGRRGGGEDPTQDGFGWIKRVMLKLTPLAADLESADLCLAGQGRLASARLSSLLLLDGGLYNVADMY